MTDNVIPFKPADPLIWVCRCGCQSWRLQSDGQIECCNCLNISCDHHGDWITHLPEPVPTDQTTAGTLIVKAMGNAGFARNGVVRTIEQLHKDDKISLLSVYDTDGYGKHWTNIETQEDKDFCLRKLHELIAIIENTGIPND